MSQFLPLSGEREVRRERSEQSMNLNVLYAKSEFP